jgi:hypothetical protein
MSKNDPALTADLSSDCDYLACGVASGGEAWAGQRLSIFILGPKAPAGREGRWIKTVPGKNCRRWAKVGRIKADACDRYNGRDDL